MNALLILIPISLILIAAAIAIFFWAVRNDQFQDLDTPKILPILDNTDDESRSSTCRDFNDSAYPQGKD